MEKDQTKYTNVNHNYAESRVLLPEQKEPITTFASFGLLKPDDAKALARAIKTNRFYFVIEEASETMSPGDIHTFQLKKDYYAEALDDPEGHFKCFLLCFKGKQGRLL